ncbi:hypothetical protein TSAR_002726 [Trichomalopsis sarcophagae]|uniref:Uncharacterized protein n=1 Tax=Trichomalopsis sarcophagae TaxID=543379 RepID=A0A232F9S7_9HYME|nr:hypothetical protein TSAR_002726 [Trichomalopsis sarcophagae]
MRTFAPLEALLHDLVPIEYRYTKELEIWRESALARDTSRSSSNTRKSRKENGAGRSNAPAAEIHSALPLLLLLLLRVVMAQFQIDSPEPGRNRLGARGKERRKRASEQRERVEAAESKSLEGRIRLFCTTQFITGKLAGYKHSANPHNVITFMELNYKFDNSMKNKTAAINANKKINGEKRSSGKQANLDVYVFAEDSFNGRGFEMLVWRYSDLLWNEVIDCNVVFYILLSKNDVQMRTQAKSTAVSAVSSVSTVVSTEADGASSESSEAEAACAVTKTSGSVAWFWYWASVD